MKESVLVRFRKNVLLFNYFEIKLLWFERDKMKGINFKERELEKDLMEGLLKLLIVWSGLGLSVICWILLL